MCMLAGIVRGLTFIRQYSSWNLDMYSLAFWSGYSWVSRVLAAAH